MVSKHTYIHRRKYTGTRRNSRGSEVSRAESSAFIDCCEGQGSQPVWKRLADAFSRKTIGLAMLGNSKAKVDVLLKKYENVFDGEKGTMKHFHAKLATC